MGLDEHTLVDDGDQSPRGESPPPLLVDVKQAARMLAISRSTLYELMWSGDLAPIRIGRSVRFSIAQLEQFVASRTDP